MARCTTCCSGFAIGLGDSCAVEASVKTKSLKSNVQQVQYISMNSFLISYDRLHYFSNFAICFIWGHLCFVSFVATAKFVVRNARRVWQALHGRFGRHTRHGRHGRHAWQARMAGMASMAGRAGMAGRAAPNANTIIALSIACQCPVLSIYLSFT